jgi:chromosomal replication initiator protein
VIDGVLELELPRADLDQASSRAAAPFVLGPENSLLLPPIQRLLTGDDLAEAARLFNPLVLVGPTGSGKSQLAQAIVRHWRGVLQHSAGATNEIAYFTAADFGRQLQTAFAEERLADWQQQVRNLKLLVIEDLQRLRRRDPIQQELRHTVDAVIEEGGVVLVTAQCEPAALTEVDLGLRDRIAAGLLVRLQSPGGAARKALLRRVASSRGMLLDDDQLARLAQREAASPAELSARLPASSGPLPLEGMGANEHGRPEVARAQCGSPSRRATREGVEAGTSPAQNAQATLKQIIAITSRYFAVTQAALIGPSRRTTLVLARNIVVQLARRHTALSYADIGHALGNRDHTTIMHADRRLTEQLATDPSLQQTFDELNGLVR